MVNEWLDSLHHVIVIIPVAVSIGVMYPLLVRSQKRVCRLNAYFERGAAIRQLCPHVLKISI